MLERTGLIDGDDSAEERVIAYHERTKHHFYRHAASLGYMDWALQPDPFRSYAGADVVRLPLPEAGRSLPYGTADAIVVGVGLALFPARTVTDGMEAIG
jgi:hypothetical protein